MLPGYVALQAHLVQGQLVFTGGLLYDGREEGLRIEETTQPDRRWQLLKYRLRVGSLDRVYPKRYNLILSGIRLYAAFFQDQEENIPRSPKKKKSLCLAQVMSLAILYSKRELSPENVSQNICPPQRGFPIMSHMVVQVFAYVEIYGPIGQFGDSIQHVCEPARQCQGGGIGVSGPGRRYRLQEYVILQILHVRADCEFSLQKRIAQSI